MSKRPTRVQRRNDRMFAMFDRAKVLKANAALALNLAPESTDQRTVAERKWQARTVAAKPQLACDEGLFGDSHLQSDLVTLARKET